MTGGVLFGLLLILGGSALGVPIVILLGAVTLMIEAVHAVWRRAGLRDVRYVRRLEGRRVAWGDELLMTIEVWNRRWLPLPWLRADDEAPFGVTVRERELTDSKERGTDVLRNAWTLRPWERVVRRFHVVTDRRGVFRIGPVELAIGDPFASQVADELRPDTATFLAWPRTLPTTEIEPPDRWGDLDRARLSLTEDPSRFAGVRPYAPGDPRRRIHAKTSARLGTPVTKRFESSRERQVLIALDVQTIDGAAWEAGDGGDEVESLYVVAASIARTLGTRRVAFGLMAAGFSGAESRFAIVPVSADPGQAGRVLDLLARLSGHASASFERLLLLVRRSVGPGTTVLVLSARDTRPFASALRGLERAGAEVVVVACGDAAPDRVEAARASGFTARRAWMDGHWRTAERLVIAP